MFLPNLDYTPHIRGRVYSKCLEIFLDHLSRFDDAVSNVTVRIGERSKLPSI